MKAGADYLASIRKLGLDPIYLGWGWEREAERWLLVLVTSIVDCGGPLALNDLLFRAYNAEATPKEISPFIIRVFSPEIIPSDRVGFLNDPDLRVASVNGEPKSGKIENVAFSLFGIDFERVNSFPATGKPIQKYGARQEAWQRFKRQVDKLAA